MPDDKHLARNGARTESSARRHPAGRTRGAQSEANESAAAFTIDLEVLGALFANGASEIYVAEPESLAIRYLNRAALGNLGYSSQDARSLTALDLVPQYTREEAAAVLAPLLDGSKPQVRVETAITRHDGTTYPVEARLQIAHHGGCVVCVALVNDISRLRDRREREQREQRAEAVVSECRRTLLDCVTEEELLAAACRTLIVTGGHCYAWIGPIVPHAGTVDIHAAESKQTSGLGIVRAICDELAGEGHESLRQRGHWTSRDHPRGGAGSSFDEALAACNAKVMLALPIQVAEGSAGVIIIGSSDEDAFGDREIQKLAPMSEDLAYGLATLRARLGHARAELKALDSEQRYRAMFEQAAVGITRVDLSGVLVDVNQKFCEFLGWSREELLGRAVKDITHPDDYERGASQRERLAMAQGRSFVGEKRFLRKDGSVVWARRTMSLAYDSAGHPQYIVSVVEDISERKALEERFQATFEQAAVGLMHTDLERRILAVNQKFCDMVGYASDELRGLRAPQIHHPQDSDADQDLERRLVAGEIDTYSFEKRYVRKDGSIMWGNRTVSLVRDSAGKPCYFIRVIEDVTERKEAERRYRALFEFAPLGMIQSGLDGRIQRVNSKLCSLLGYTSDELLRMTVSELVHPDHRGSDAPRFMQPMLENRMQSYAAERLYLHRDGRTVWVNRTVSLIRDSAGKPLYFIRVVEDITERHRSAQRRMTEYAATRVLAEVASLEEAMPRLIRTIAEGMGWQYGAYWTWEAPSSELRRWFFWSDAARASTEMYDESWRVLTTSRPGGLMRRALDTGLPVCIPDIALVEGFQRRESAIRMGFRSAYAFPVTAGADIIGVLEFFAVTNMEPDEMLLQTARSLGSQIGQFVQRKQAEETLRVSDERFRVAFNQASVAMSITGLDFKFLQVNETYCKLTGYSADALSGMTIRDVIREQDIADASRLRAGLLAGERDSYQRERQLRRKDGGLIWVNVVASLIRDGSGRPVHFVTMMQDVSERKQAEQALRESEERFRQLADNVPEAFWVIEARTWQLIYVNPAGERMLGQPATELSSDTRHWMRLVHPEDRVRVRAAKRRLLTGQGYEEEFRIVRQDGSVRWIQDCAIPLRDASGEMYRIAGISADITQRKEYEQKLVHLAHYDVLTGLPNRVLFYDRLKQALAQARRNGWMTAVLFLDLDRFKNVNDTLGHVVGDELLNLASARLLGCIRTGDTVGRLGGDEFAIVLSNVAGQHDASLVAQKIMSVLIEPFILGGGEVFVTASIGITLYPTDSTDQDTLIRNADTAMYRAKDLGRNSCQFYTTEMNARALEKLSLESSLRRAIERDEFLLYYQPKVSLATGEVTGVEALLRWRHPELGLVSPGQFMPMLEETGLILSVGEWVIRNACEQVREWETLGLRSVPIAVNLSARQFQAQDLSERVAVILKACDVEGRMLELELTESSLIGNTEEVVQTLGALGALGIRLSVDDFGTGYSNLNYLKRFPLDTLKIDGSFTRDVISDVDDAAITRAIITMAHYLDLSVVAEGVETEQQLQFLQAHGCDQIQGYYFSRPLPAEDCTALLRSGKRLQMLASSDGENGAPGILLVDDDEDALLLLKRELLADGYQVYTAGDGREGLRLLGLHDIRVIVSDYSMPGMSGVDFLQRAKALHPEIVRIMLTSQADITTVTAAVNRSSIYRFVSKDWGNAHLRRDIRQALAMAVQAPDSR